MISGVTFYDGRHDMLTNVMTDVMTHVMTDVLFWQLSETNKERLTARVCVYVLLIDCMRMCGCMCTGVRARLRT